VALARSHGCLFLECSAKNRSGVAQAFQELVQRILDTPSLLAETAPAQINLRAKSKAGATGCNC
jgi:Ras-related protein Rab-18